MLASASPEEGWSGATVAHGRSFTAAERDPMSVRFAWIAIAAVAVTPQVSSSEPGRSAATLRPFRSNVPDDVLADLRRRVKATRWPDRETVSDRSQGV